MLRRKHLNEIAAKALKIKEKGAKFEPSAADTAAVKELSKQLNAAASEISDFKAKTGCLFTEEKYQQHF